jgi:hypothetical protein
MFSKCCAIVPNALHKEMLKKNSPIGYFACKCRLDKEKATLQFSHIFYVPQPVYEKKPSFASL